MSEREQSYYEIALTHNQVLVAFVVFLSGIVAAFFLGLWIGRDASPPPRPPTEAVVADTGEAEAEPREFEFFDNAGEGTESEVAESVPATEPPDETTPGETEAEEPTTLEQDLERDRSSGAESPEASEPTTGRGAEEQDEASPPEATAERAESGYIIQVLSSRQERQARELASRLRDAGYDAHSSSFRDDGRTMYRVRVGPFETRGRAEEVADEVRNRFTLDTWVTEVD